MKKITIVMATTLCIMLSLLLMPQESFGTQAPNMMNALYYHIVPVQSATVAVSSFDNTYHQWLTVGDAPWLNANDDTNYLWDRRTGTYATTGWFGFGINLISDADVKNAYLTVWTKTTDINSGHYVEVFDNGGHDWGSIYPNATYSPWSIPLSYITYGSQLNGFKFKLEFVGDNRLAPSEGAAPSYTDYSIIYVTYATLSYDGVYHSYPTEIWGNGLLYNVGWQNDLFNSYYWIAFGLTDGTNGQSYTNLVEVGIKDHRTFFYGAGPLTDTVTIYFTYYDNGAYSTDVRTVYYQQVYELKLTRASNNWDAELWNGQYWVYLADHSFSTNWNPSCFETSIESWTQPNTGQNGVPVCWGQMWMFVDGKWLFPPSLLPVSINGPFHANCTVTHPYYEWQSMIDW